MAGGGKRDKFDAAELRKLTGAVVRALKSKAFAASHWLWMSLALGSTSWRPRWKARFLRILENDRYKTDPKKNEKRVDSFSVLGGSKAALDRGRILAEAQNFTRDLANEPANVLAPLLLADRAKEMASEFGLECEILDQDRMRQLGMGALLGVSQGSAEPPALIVIRYKPAKAPTSKDHLGLIGKGVTFDTAESPSSRPRAWKRCGRHGGRRGGAGRHASHCATQAIDSGNRAGTHGRKYARQ